MMDSKSEPGASRFISRTDKTLRFSIKAFQFTSDPDTEVRFKHDCPVTLLELWLNPPPHLYFRSSFTANYPSHQKDQILHTSHALTEGTGLSTESLNCIRTEQVLNCF